MGERVGDITFQESWLTGTVEGGSPAWRAVAVARTNLLPGVDSAPADLITKTERWVRGSWQLLEDFRSEWRHVNGLNSAEGRGLLIAATLNGDPEKFRLESLSRDVYTFYSNFRTEYELLNLLSETLTHESVLATIILGEISRHQVDSALCAAFDLLETSSIKAILCSLEYYKPYVEKARKVEAVLRSGRETSATRRSELKNQSDKQCRALALKEWKSDPKLTVGEVAFKVKMESSDPRELSTIAQVLKGIKPRAGRSSIKKKR